MFGQCAIIKLVAYVSITVRYTDFSTEDNNMYVQFGLRCKYIFNVTKDTLLVKII